MNHPEVVYIIINPGLLGISFHYQYEFSKVAKHFVGFYLLLNEMQNRFQRLIDALAEVTN